MNRWQRLAGERGQATVELVALVPLLAAVALIVGGFLAAHAAREAADQAAVAGAVAQLQGTDPVRAGRSASPSWAKLSVRVRGGTVIAEVTPRLPRALGRLVDARAEVVTNPSGAR